MIFRQCVCAWSVGDALPSCCCARTRRRGNYCTAQPRTHPHAHLSSRPCADVQWVVQAGWTDPAFHAEGQAYVAAAQEALGPFCRAHKPYINMVEYSPGEWVEGAAADCEGFHSKPASCHDWLSGRDATPCTAQLGNTAASSHQPFHHRNLQYPAAALHRPAHGARAGGVDGARGPQPGATAPGEGPQFHSCGCASAAGAAASAAATFRMSG